MYFLPLECNKRRYTVLNQSLLTRENALSLASFFSKDHSIAWQLDRHKILLTKTFPELVEVLLTACMLLLEK